MTLRAVFDIRKPDDVEMRLTAIMPLKDWKRVAEALDAGQTGSPAFWHPAAELTRIIADMVRKAETTFSDQSDDPKVPS